MSSPERIAVFYSQGPHFERAVQHMAKSHPTATITAIVPHVESIVHMAEEITHHVVTTDARTGLLTSLRLISALRKKRYDHFVVLFPSFRLQLLASAVGADQRFCYAVDGHVTALRGGPLTVAMTFATRRVAGTLRYLSLALLVRILKVQS